MESFVKEVIIPRAKFGVSPDKTFGEIVAFDYSAGFLHKLTTLYSLAGVKHSQSRCYHGFVSSYLLCQALPSVVEQTLVTDEVCILREQEVLTTMPINGY